MAKTTTRAKIWGDETTIAEATANLRTVWRNKTYRHTMIGGPVKGKPRAGSWPAKLEADGVTVTWAKFTADLYLSLMGHWTKVADKGSWALCIESPAHNDVMLIGQNGGFITSIATRDGAKYRKYQD